MQKDPPGWPRFQPAVFEIDHRVPAAAREAFSGVDLPKNLMGRYRSSSELLVVNGPGRRMLIRFGEFGPEGNACYDPASGEVVSLVVGKRRVQRPVNESLTCFHDCAQAALDLFPYYRANSSRNETHAAAAALRARLTDTDPTALEVSGFWSSFADEVGRGGLSTEDVLASYGEGVLIVEDELYRAFRSSYEIAYKRLPSDPHRLCPNCDSDALRIAFEASPGAATATVAFWCAYCLLGLDQLSAPAPKGARVFRSGSPDKGAAAAFPELRSVRFLRRRPDR